MSWKDLHDIAIDLIICPLCNALSGDWCKTVTGRRAKYPHESRMWPVRQAYALGWEDGKEDTFRMAGTEYFEEQAIAYRVKWEQEGSDA